MSSFIDKLAWIRIENRRVLSTLSKGKETFYIPGGKRKPGESDEEALRREIREELSVELVPETIRPFGVFEAQAHGKTEGVVVRMTCFMADFRGELRAAAEIERFEWLDFSGQEKSSPVDKLIFAELKERDLID